MCDTKCIQPVHPETRQSERTWNNHIILHVFYVCKGKSIVYVFGSIGLQYPTVTSHYFIYILILYLKIMEVCDKLFLPKIKGFRSLRFCCWTGKEQRAWSVKAEGEKGKISHFNPFCVRKTSDSYKINVGCCIQLQQ